MATTAPKSATQVKEFKKENPSCFKASSSGKENLLTKERKIANKYKWELIQKLIITPEKLRRYLQEIKPHRIGDKITSLISINSNLLARFYY